MAKKSETRQRQKIIAVRVSDAEWEMIDRKAEDVGLCLSSFMRYIVLGSADRNTVRRINPDKVALARILTALGPLGGDVRQILHLSETGALATTREGISDMRHILATVSALRQDLVKALGLRE